MKDRLSDGTKVSRWWNQFGLGEIVEEWNRAQQIQTVFDLLSPDYRRAIGSWREVAAVQPRYPQGFQADFRRGQDLALLLSGESLKEESHRNQPKFLTE